MAWACQASPKPPAAVLTALHRATVWIAVAAIVAGCTSDGGTGHEATPTPGPPPPDPRDEPATGLAAGGALLAFPGGWSIHPLGNWSGQLLVNVTVEPSLAGASDFHEATPAFALVAVYPLGTIPCLDTGFCMIRQDSYAGAVGYGPRQDTLMTGAGTWHLLVASSGPLTIRLGNGTEAVDVQPQEPPRPILAGPLAVDRSGSTTPNAARHTETWRQALEAQPPSVLMVWALRVEAPPGPHLRAGSVDEIVEIRSKEDPQGRGVSAPYVVTGHVPPGPDDFTVSGFPVHCGSTGTGDLVLERVRSETWVGMNDVRAETLALAVPYSDDSGTADVGLTCRGFGT